MRSSTWHGRASAGPRRPTISSSNLPRLLTKSGTSRIRIDPHGHSTSKSDHFAKPGDDKREDAIMSQLRIFSSLPNRRRALGLADRSVWHNLTMEKEKVDAFQFRPGETLVKAALEARQDLLAGRVAEHTFGRYAHPVGEAAIEGRADDKFGFAFAVGRSEVEKGDAGLHGITYGGDRFVAAGRAPDLTDATAAKRKAAYLAEFSKCPFFHRCNVAFFESSRTELA